MALATLEAAQGSPVHWNSDDSGPWRASERWAPGLPTAGDDVILDRPNSDPTVSLVDGDDFSVRSLNNAETLTFAGGSLTLTGGESTSTGIWNQASGRLTVANAGTTFTATGPMHMTGGDVFAVAGGKLIARGPSSYGGSNTASSQLVAQGVGSQLDLGALAAFAGSSGGWQTQVRAESGGRIDLSALPKITAGATVVEALSAGSVVDLASLQEFEGDPAGALSGLHANNAAILTPQLTSLRNAYLQIDGGGSIDTQALVRAQSCSFLTGFGRLEFPALTEFSVSGGAVSQILPVGATGKIRFPALTTMDAGDGTIQAWAVAAGTLELSSVTTITGASVDIRADNWGSVVDLSALTDFHPTEGGFIRATSGGVIRLNPSGTTTVTNTIVELTPIGTIEVGTLILGAGSRMTRIGPLSGNLTNEAGAIDPHKLLPGEQVIEGSFAQESSGVFRVDLGGLSPGAQHDLLTVTGSAALAGSLVVNRIDGFVPAYGDAFRILSAADVTGTLAIAPPGAASTGLDAGEPHLIFATFYAADGVDLRVVLAGDANADGLVSGADFTLWSDHFGERGGGYARADFNSDGEVTGADFTLWADNFGATTPEQRAMHVPEPAAAWLAALAAVCLLSHRRRAALDR